MAVSPTFLICISFSSFWHSEWLLIGLFSTFMYIMARHGASVHGEGRDKFEWS